MAEFTFFEFHMHGDVKSSGSKSGSGMLPFGSGSKSSGGDSESMLQRDTSGGTHIDVQPESEQGGGSRGTQMLIGLALLVGIAAAARVLRGDDESQTELEQFEEVTPEP